MILNSEPLEEVDCFKYMGSQVAADGGCERDVVDRMNEGYRTWGVLKSVLSNRGLGCLYEESVYMKKCLYEESVCMKECLYEGVIVPTALYHLYHLEQTVDMRR